MRLDKYLSNAGYGSRSEIKKLIKNGIVTVNGKICKNPSQNVSLNTQIKLNSKIAVSKPVSTIMLNKPKDYVSSNEREAGYPSVMELIRQPHPRYSIAGRLDVDTTGLLILSTNGELIHSIISPLKKVSKLYKAAVINFKDEASQYFFKGMALTKNFKSKPVTCFQVLSKENGIATINIGIVEGKFHQIKRMFQHVQAEVIELERIAIGSLKIDSSLKPGEYRELTETEIKLIFS